MYEYEYKKNDRQEPYTSSLLNLITICENNLKNLNKKRNIAKIKAIIVMCTTLISSFTILRPIMYFSLIGSCLINIAETYKLKKQLYNIQEHKKAIVQINKFLNLEMELDKEKKISRNTIDKFTLSMSYLTDLYECFQAKSIKLLGDITQKYEKKFNDNLIIFNHRSSEGNEQPISRQNDQTRNDLPNNSQNYFLPSNRKYPINGYQYIKTYYEGKGMMI